MTKAELNSHEIVAPALAYWRAARDENDYVRTDKRYSHQTVRETRVYTDAWERVYDAAVRMVLA